VTEDLALLPLDGQHRLSALAAAKEARQRQQTMALFYEFNQPEEED
jgi:hypothetical protein